MAAAIQMTQGDLLPILTATLSDANGVVDLTGCTVTFTMTSNFPPTNTLTTAKVNAQACAVVSELAGQVSYTWQAGDTSAVGLFYGQFEVVDGSAVWHFPNTTALIQIQINPAA